MAYYDALVTKWATLTPGTTDAKLTQLNGLTATGASQKAVLSPSQILNAIVFTDLATFTQLQVSQLTLLLAGTAIDASVGTTIRAGIQALFTGKTTSLANLGTLVAPFDSPTVLWWQSAAYPRAFDLGDITAAGLS
jgi:hypothetical protein